MGQSFKSVYFKDYPRAASGRPSLTLAFGENDRELFEAVRHLSSDTIRQALGYQSFATLTESATENQQTLNAYCLGILRRQFEGQDGSSTLYLPGLEPTYPLQLDPLQATFSGGHHEPMHEWYPYLEGYSPAFVESVLGSYCPDATSIFDPFAGTGTTPLTAARLGKRAYFSEINPVLQFLTESKIVALQLRDRDRVNVVARLRELGTSIDETLKNTNPDLNLNDAHIASFGESVFFDNATFSEVLRYRTLADQVCCREPTVGRLLTIAVLRTLIPASMLIRRGDLRFKNEKELERGCVKLKEGVSASLHAIARDLESLSPIDHPPTLILENTKNLGRIPELAMDAVITSPPYLNGTNYFRNTKVELWFLRCIKDKTDLARFRFDSMTVGINGVTVGKPIGRMPPCTESIIKELEANSYDVRIPRMVACFASEMHDVLQCLALHMAENGTIVIDIGDSAYAGVHVPTDRFITESMHVAGFTLRYEHLLRQRYSRSQMKLTQKLLVFERRSVKRAGSRLFEVDGRDAWADGWSRFKDSLPHQQPSYAKRNWGHSLHSLCSYQGKMKPSLAAHLIRTFTSKGDTILDPFSGVGTIPFEAALHGVKSWAFDISPPAVHVTAGKIGKTVVSHCNRLVQRLGSYFEDNCVSGIDLKSAASIRFNGALTSYYNRETFREILLARRFFLENPPSNPSESLVLACLLHILHGNRPYALSRRSHPITPFAPKGPREYRALLPRLRDKLKRSLTSPNSSEFVYGCSKFQDATEWWPSRHPRTRRDYYLPTILQQYAFSPWQLDKAMVLWLGVSGFSRTISRIRGRTTKAQF